MIAVQDIVTQRTAILDDEGSQRYLFDQDHRPAINHALDTIVSAVNSLFAENKLSPENLRELNYTRVWNANEHGRVYMNPAALGHSVWTVLGVYPEPVLNVTPNVLGLSAAISVYRNSVTPKELPFAAKRLTQEQWSKGKRNIFTPGSDYFSDTNLKEYAYLDHSNYTSTTYQPGGAEITIRPVPPAPNRWVAIAYLAVPARVQTINDNIAFPASMLHLIVQMSLRYTAYKQGDGSNLIGLTSSEVTQLLSMMN